jgi:Arylsulfotransferase (ASST)
MQSLRLTSAGSWLNRGVSTSLSRRDFLTASGAALAALAVPRHAYGSPSAISSPVGTASYVSEPSLRPPTLTVSTLTHPAPGYVFLASLNGPGQRGPLIIDNAGNVVFFRPLDQVAINFRRQIYKGKPVLTWWQGVISNLGTGEGEGVIVDETYSTVAHVRAGNGLEADVHELLLTANGTALITVYNQVQADLTSVGGPVSGAVLDSIIQEIDVQTGRVVFEWHSLDHVPLTDTYAPVLDPFDYFHVNSIDVDTDGNLLVSARNTSAVYKLDRSSGRVLWRLSGRSSDFELGPDAQFMYQHDARGHPDGTITLFDDGPGPSSQQSRAIRLGINPAAMRAELLQDYRHPEPLASAAMGNAQVLGGEAQLVGWGTQPYVTEFGPTGDVRFDAKFDGGAWNYRAFRDTWVGRPTTKPSVAAVRKSGGVNVFASWNGSTETRHWRVSAGSSAASLHPVKTSAAGGFETAIHIAGRPRFVSVAALDASHRPIGSSHAVRVRA